MAYSRIAGNARAFQFEIDDGLETGPGECAGYHTAIDEESWGLLDVEFLGGLD